MAPSTTTPLTETLDPEQISKPRVLVAVIPADGHFERLRIIAADLVTRGYQVSVLTGSCYRERVENIGARFIPLTGVADFDFANNQSLWPERKSIRLGFAQFCYDVCNVWIPPMADQYECVQRFLKEATASSADPIVIVQDTIFLGTIPPVLGGPGLRPAGLITIGICPLLLCSVDTAPYNMCLPPDSSGRRP